MNRRIALSLAGLAMLCLFDAAPGFAQSSTERIQKGPIVTGTGENRPTKSAPPPGLPGAAVGKDRVTPAERTTTDLPPTDALFDAINRGDIVSARDALARGADFSGRNVLGLTPLDESIDLGRNDITFLLLSLRGAAPQSEPPAQVAGKPGKPGARPAATREAVQEPPRKPAPAPRTVASQPQPPRPVAQIQGPRSGDTGTPNPQSGFLGFGG